MLLPGMTVALLVGPVFLARPMRRATSPWSDIWYCWSRLILVATLPVVTLRMSPLLTRSAKLVAGALPGLADSDFKPPSLLATAMATVPSGPAARPAFRPALGRLSDGMADPAVGDEVRARPGWQQRGAFPPAMSRPPPSPLG